MAAKLALQLLKNPPDLLTDSVQAQAQQAAQAAAAAATVRESLLSGQFDR